MIFPDPLQADEVTPAGLCQGYAYSFGLFGTDNANVLADYRALSQDYKDGNGRNEFKWDMTLHGPVLGLAINF